MAKTCLGYLEEIVRLAGQDATLDVTLLDVEHQATNNLLNCVYRAKISWLGVIGQISEHGIVLETERG